MSDSAVRIGLAATAAALALSGCRGGAGQPQGRQTPSGLPVPRYVSLKFDDINARQGPGDDYRLLWVYRAKDLPVQVIEETQEWRRVCDPTGAVAWVKATGVDGRRTAVSTGAGPLPLLEKPADGSKTTAVLAARSAAFLEKCSNGWCRLHTKRGGGWAPASALWGVDASRQCR